MFSLIVSKPFFVVQRSNQRWGQFENRLTDTLHRLGCGDRMLAVDDNIILNKVGSLENEISEVLEKHKKESVDYLRKSIESVICQKNQ